MAGAAGRPSRRTLEPSASLVEFDGDEVADQVHAGVSGVRPQPGTYVINMWMWVVVA
jgi:hypothetical protein